MTKKKGDTTSTRIQEGKIIKGGRNEAPKTPRPSGGPGSQAPKGSPGGKDHKPPAK